MADASQTPLLWGFQELLDLREHVFGYLLKIPCRLELPYSLGDGVPDLVARRNRRGSNCIGFLETHAHRTQVHAAGATELADLAFFGSAVRAEHFLELTFRLNSTYLIDQSKPFAFDCERATGPLQSQDSSRSFLRALRISPPRCAYRESPSPAQALPCRLSLQGDRLQE